MLRNWIVVGTPASILALAQVREARGWDHDVAVEKKRRRWMRMDLRGWIL